MKRLTVLVALVATMGAALVIASCGDDDDNEKAVETAPRTTEKDDGDIQNRAGGAGQDDSDIQNRPGGAAPDPDDIGNRPGGAAPDPDK